MTINPDNLIAQNNQVTKQKTTQKTKKSWFDRGGKNYLALQRVTQKIITYVLFNKDMPSKLKEKAEQALEFTEENRIPELLSQHSMTWYLFYDYKNFKKIVEYNRYCGEVATGFSNYVNKKTVSAEAKALKNEYRKALDDFKSNY